MIDAATTARGFVMCTRCHASLYLPPSRSRSGPVRFEPHRNGRSYANSPEPRVGPVTLHLGEQRPDLLRVARRAALADVDVAADELERRIRHDVRRRRVQRARRAWSAEPGPIRRSTRRRGCRRSAVRCCARSPCADARKLMARSPGSSRRAAPGRAAACRKRPAARP